MTSLLRLRDVQAAEGSLISKRPAGHQSILFRSVGHLADDETQWRNDASDFVLCLMNGLTDGSKRAFCCPLYVLSFITRPQFDLEVC